MAKIEGHFSRELVAVESGTSCREAAERMVRHRIGATAVREGGRTVGLVTERDLVARLVANGLDAAAPVTAAMRRDLPLVGPDTTESECAALMRHHHTRHLLVARNGEVAGIISMRDVIQLMLDEKQSLIEQLERYITT